MGRVQKMRMFKRAPRSLKFSIHSDVAILKLYRKQKRARLQMEKSTYSSEI